MVAAVAGGVLPPPLFSIIKVNILQRALAVPLSQTQPMKCAESGSEEELPPAMSTHIITSITSTTSSTRTTINNTINNISSTINNNGQKSRER
jgi:hypothetical protein